MFLVDIFLRWGRAQFNSFSVIKGQFFFKCKAQDFVEQKLIVLTFSVIARNLCSVPTVQCTSTYIYSFKE